MQSTLGHYVEEIWSRGGNVPLKIPKCNLAHSPQKFSAFSEITLWHSGARDAHSGVATSRSRVGLVGRAGTSGVYRQLLFFYRAGGVTVPC